MLTSLTVTKKSQLFFKFIKPVPFSIKFKKHTTKLSNKFLGSCVRINFVKNNIYCTFWSVTGKRTFRVRSAGMKKLKTSKKRLFFYGKLFLEFFFKELTQWHKKYRNKKAFLFISLKVPKRFRKIILKYISRKAAVINFEYSKAFNGCKAKKKRRKKRLGFRKFK